MNIIGCLDIPDSGDYILDGEYVDNCTEDQLSEIRGIKSALSFSSSICCPDLTAYENVEMPLLYRKISPAAERHERVMKTLKQVGLEGRMQHKPSQLSGGQQQRVAIARVLASEPSIILADEPTGNLDSTVRQGNHGHYSGFVEGRNTIVLITHDIHVAESGGTQGLRSRWKAER